MESFEFIFILHLMIKVLGLTNDLSNALQQKDQNIVNAMGLIVTVKELIQDLRENGWGKFLEEVKSFCVAMSVSVPNMEDSTSSRSFETWRAIDSISTTRSQCYTMIDDIDVDEEVVDVNNDGSGPSYQMLFD
ncbi:uncharacterized protein LOC120265224 [Dioscorea cayenensis subsp. rotundata]|uniref:Uncharacterized protein LOC120265224 n=1 Tax=Dioscorea cayennensis subsp. rotundata TaxID=55577 RepID=A0AB40BNP7_DIOCR|nr:uncharacterized protein LOC120265224 [Dioscorea cayenensis subsp. rotundata]